MSALLVNSYKRLIPGSLAGYWANWGLDNRISTYRAPYERGPATRIENRMPCGSANPYLGRGGDAERSICSVPSTVATAAPPQIGDGDSRLPTPTGTLRTISARRACPLRGDRTCCAKRWVPSS